MKNIKLKDAILHNFALKIIAVVLAVIIWVVIVNIDNPSRTMTISGIPVTFLNEEVLTEKGYTYAVQTGSVISISVKAPQSIVENLQASDFYAYADLGELSPTSDSAKISVRCEKTDVANQIDIVNIKSDFVKLSIDNKLSKDIQIEAVYRGTPAEGYVVGECNVSPATITVTGAETAINKITSARVTYNISNMTTSVLEDARISYYDEKGIEVKSELISANRTTARISIAINPTKKIPINYAATGTPAEGYVLSECKSSLDSIEIAAAKDMLDKLSSIDIPAGVIDVEGISDNASYEIPIAVYIPAGYTIVSEENVLKVEAKVLRKVEIAVPYETISLSGCSNLYDYVIDEDDKTITITVIGPKEKVEKLTKENIYLSASVGGKSIGKYTVRLEVENIEECFVEDNYEIHVNITEKKAPEKETEKATDKETDKESDKENDKENETKDSGDESGTDTKETESGNDATKESEMEAEKKSGN